MKRTLVVGVALVVAATAAVLIVTQMSGRAAGPPDLRVEPATVGAIESAVLATGTLTPVVTVVVGSEVSGKIATLTADFNSPVVEGEVIATIDPATYRAKLDQAAADLAVAEATVAVKQAALEASRADRQTAANLLADTERTVDRTRRLNTAGHATDKQLQADELARAQAEVGITRAAVEERVAEAELAVAIAEVGQRKAAVAIAETDIARTIIRSPVTGVVVDRQVDIGQTVAASLQAPVLFEIAQDLREMRLEASVDEADIGRVAPGQAVAFTVDAFPERRFDGTVSQVRKAATVVSNVTTYTVVVDTRNDDLTLLPGMTANVRILEDRRDGVVKVPAAALRFRPEGARAAAGGNPAGGSALYVVGRDGRPERRQVTTGLASDGEVEIVAGLAAGEAVVTGRAATAAAGRRRGPMGF